MPSPVGTRLCCMPLLLGDSSLQQTSSTWELAYAVSLSHLGTHLCSKPLPLGIRLYCMPPSLGTHLYCMSPPLGDSPLQQAPPTWDSPLLHALFYWDSPLLHASVTWGFAYVVSLSYLETHLCSKPLLIGIHLCCMPPPP
ncbi:hypothetical protein Adt_13960 [Abeliophyllum distichum]|uniref:Uncharacterized protein n=1 Tax=Abeliophyllum distichum TaxID=126358 RepID=A0ABD1TYV9_9LAMI